MDTKTMIPMKSPKTACRIIDREAVIILLDKQKSVVVNEVGTRVWEFIDGKNSLEDIAQVIAAEFETTPEVALRDVRSFLEDMHKEETVFWKENG